jgi:hypothetical protein
VASELDPPTVVGDLESTKDPKLHPRFLCIKFAPACHRNATAFLNPRRTDTPDRRARAAATNH